MRMHAESRHSPAADVTTEQPAHWADARACRDEDPELFFPPRHALQRIEDAKRICGRCPVRDECLNVALETEQDFGVWGGMSEQERREMHGRRPIYPVASRRFDELIAAPGEVLRLAGLGWSRAAIAAALRTNVATINKVLAALAEQQAASCGDGVR